MTDADRVRGELGALNPSALAQVDAEYTAMLRRHYRDDQLPPATAPYSWVMRRLRKERERAHVRG